MSDQTPHNWPLHEDSLLAHGGATGPDKATGAVVPPIPMASTFARGEDYELIEPSHLYSRDDNELFRRVEALIATLECGDASRLFASGMAAIAATVRLVKPGGTLLVQSGIYWGTTLFLRKMCQRANIALIESDATDRTAFTEDIAIARPDLVFLEVPGNPFLQVADIGAISEACRASNALLAVDATVATPLLLKPLTLGADISIHSATKALNGHSDLLGGVVTIKDKTSWAWQVLTEERKLAGAVMGSLEAWLLLRGLRTLSLRVERMAQNAAELAEFLHNHPKIDAVLYPGLPSHDGHELAKTMMTGGYGSLMSILVKGGADEALKMAGGLQLIQRATSLGGTESLIEHRYSIEGPESGIPPNLLRISAGIEHIGDLKADLTKALALL